MRRDLAGARLSDGSVEVSPQLQVTGLAKVFALGDVAAADLQTAGRAGRQADVVVANIRALLEGGEHMFVDVYRERFGLAVPCAR